VLRRSPLLLWAGAGAVALLTALALRRFPLPTDSEFTVCFVRRATGVSCPGCGMTRALASLARGEWERAYSFHPLSFVVAVELVAGWLAWGAWRLRDRPLVARSTVNATLIANAGALLLVWAVRLAQGTLPP
jgi:hypothetical protein